MKKPNEKKQILKSMLNGIGLSILTFYAIEFIQRLALPQTIAYPEIPLVVLGSLVLLILYLFFRALTNSNLIASGLLFFLSISLAIASRIKYSFRAEPLYPHELRFATEISFLIEMMGWPAAILILLTIVLGTIGIILFYRKKIKPKKKKRASKQFRRIRVLTLIVTLLSLISIGRFNQLGNPIRKLYRMHMSNPHQRSMTVYFENGLIAGFLNHLNAPPMETPVNYSKENIQEIVEKYQAVAEEWNADLEETLANVNVLFVMNESFADPMNLEGIDANKDPLPYFRSLADATLSGQVLSSTYGGGTDANEFMALTGFSMEPLAAHYTTPYEQLDERTEHYPNLLHKLKALDYQATAIHPYDPTFFNRETVYQQMKFDQFLHEETMEHQEKASEDHLYISDASVYKEAFSVLNEIDKPDFIHMVTMQNHTPYDTKYTDIEYEVTGTGNEEEASGYFTDLESSDEALQALIDQIDNHPEPILLLFWGDHLPGLYSEQVRIKNPAHKLQETPFLLYSNTEDLKSEYDWISPDRKSDV